MVDVGSEEVALGGMVARRAGRKLHPKDFGSHFYLTFLGCSHTSEDSGADKHMTRRRLDGHWLEEKTEFDDQTVKMSTRAGPWSTRF